jgi:hypothetical protein
MSTIPSTDDILQRTLARSGLPAADEAQLERWQWRALAVGVATMVVCIIGAFFDPGQFFRAYLSAYQFYLGIGVGCWVILMLYHLTGGAWGFLIRRILEAAMRTLPLLAVLFTPVACGVGSLYLWARPEIVAGSAELRYNHIYLNKEFFWARAALYFISWIAITFILDYWSRQQDRTGNPRISRWNRLLSAPSLVWYGATITFASVDWVMSLQPSFHSTIFGPYYATGQILSGMAFALLLLSWLAYRPPLADIIALETLNDLGNLLFAFLIIWAYMTYFQFMLIWIADLRDEVIYFLPRSRGGWQWVAWAIFVLHFAVPFFLLLMRDIKRNPKALGAVAGLVLGMHLVFSYFQIMPPFWGTTIADHWMDFLTPFAVGGLWVAYFLWQFRRRPLLAVNDPSRGHTAELRHLDLEEAARQEAIHHA